MLVDTGAKEVIRPRNNDSWNEIMVRREKGKTCHSEAGRWCDNPGSHDTGWGDHDWPDTEQK
eukprot:12636650-Prorocentrum_lima.AAC.1